MTTQQASVSPQPAGKRICMLVYAFYEHDNRVMRYARTLVARGDEVDVVALAADEKQPAFEKIEGVNVHRIQRRQRNEKNKFSYLFRLIRFCGKSSFVLGRRHLRSAYDLVHVHNIPDFLVFSTWLPKLGGAKIVLDIHDIMPEFFANKFRKPQGSIYVRMLKWVEFVSTRFADHVIVSNHLWHDKITARSVPREKCSVFVNHVEPGIFGGVRTRNDGKIVMLYHGGLQRHQGLDIAIRAFAQISPQAPNAEFHIYGGGNVKPELQVLAQKLGLDGRVYFFESLPMREIADVVANADLGVVAKRADSFGDEAYSTKIMEFMASGVPVIVSKTKIDSFYFNDSVVRFFESGNENDLAGAMLDLMRNPELRQTLVHNAAEYVARNNWNLKKREYLNLVDALLSPEGLRSGALVEKSTVCR
jgi:glycosyltransferase involved in cell wall biosynthesis